MIAFVPKRLLLTCSVVLALSACSGDQDTPPATAAAPATDAAAPRKLTLDESTLPGVNRFEIGDLTRTDVAQAESRAAIARGELETAEAQLKGSIEEFRRLTGLEVVRLAPLPPLQDLPANAEMAAATALEENPQLISARSKLESQRYEVKAARAEALPKVSAVLTQMQPQTQQVFLRDARLVEYALSRSLSPALVAQYQTQLPDKKLLQAKLHEFYLANVGKVEAE